MYNPWPNPGPRVPVFSGAPHPQPGAPRSYLSTPTPAISRRNAPMQAPNPGLWGHQHVGLPPGPPVPIPAVAAQLSMHWNVNITTRHQRDHVVRAGQAIAPGWRFTNLTVDSGDPEKTVGLSPLALLPRIYTLDLKCGWWNWEDLSRLPGNAPHLNMMQACHLTFEHGMNSVAGLERHWKIFTHPTLRALSIEQRGNYPEPDDHSFMDHVDVESLKGTLALTSLQLQGLDVHTLSRVLELPRALEYLTLQFAPKRIPQYFFVRLTMDRSDEVLGNLFSPLLSSLISLDFQHMYLSNFKWGMFQRLRYLRVHEDHFFPYVGRVWGDLTLGDLIPPTLETLEIFGCKFGVKPQISPPFPKGSEAAVENDRLGAALRRLADELAVGYKPGVHDPIEALLDDENDENDEDGDGGAFFSSADNGSIDTTVDDAMVFQAGPHGDGEAALNETFLNGARERAQTPQHSSRRRCRHLRVITIQRAEGLVPANLVPEGLVLKALAWRFREQGISFSIKAAALG